MRPHTKLGTVLLAAVVGAGACSSTAGRASFTTRTSGRASVAPATKGSNGSTDSSGQTSGTAINLNIKARVTQRDNGRTLNLRVGDGIAVGFTGTFCVISIDPPDMLAFYEIPTPPNWLFLHVVKPGRAALVARGSCNAQYAVTIVVL
jgi:hypothetical protein